MSELKPWKEIGGGDKMTGAWKIDGLLAHNGDRAPLPEDIHYAHDRIHVEGDSLTVTTTAAWDGPGLLKITVAVPIATIIDLLRVNGKLNTVDER
jgi:hypothetical protein